METMIFSVVIYGSLLLSEVLGSIVGRQIARVKSTIWVIVL